MVKNNKLFIPVTTEEKKLLQKRANAVGLTLAAYCRYVLIQTKPKPPSDYFE